MKRVVLFILAFFCFFGSTYGQKVFSGSVKEEKGAEPLSDVVCRVTDSQGKRTLGYCMTDKGGALQHFGDFRR